MNNEQVIQAMQVMVLGITKLAERVKAAEAQLQAAGVTVEAPSVSVAAPNVSLPEITVEGASIDLAPLAEAINGLSGDNIAEAVAGLVGPLQAIVGKEINLDPLTEAGQATAAAVAGFGERFATLAERSIAVQEQTSFQMAALAHDAKNSADLNSQQFNALFDALNKLQLAVTAPKRLVMDGEGNPIGVETGQVQ